MSNADESRRRTGIGKARTSLYASINLSGITVRKAVTEEDFELVTALRKSGYSRFSMDSGKETDWVDEIDRLPENSSLIAYDDDNRPVATMRIQDSRSGPLELGKFVPLKNLLREEYMPAAQIARLSVTKIPKATEAMFGMFKASWLWCIEHGIESMVIASPPWARHFHQFMHFEDLGQAGYFHHEFAKGALHITMRLPVFHAERIWREHQNPLCVQMIDIDHPSLRFY